MEDLPIERTLGQYWNCEEDTFCLELDSKRTILAAVSSIFDLLRLLAPIVLVPKILLQDIRRMEEHWDDPLPNDIVSGPRSSRSPLLNTQLHVFSGASEAGFRAVAYKIGIGVTVSFAIAKSRVAPTRPLVGTDPTSSLRVKER